MKINVAVVNRLPFFFAVLAIFAVANCQAAGEPAPPVPKKVSAPAKPASGAKAAEVPVPVPVTAQCPSADEFAAVNIDVPVVVISPKPTETAQPSASAGPLVALGHKIEVHVSGLKALLAREKCSATHKKIVLFVDHRPVPGATPSPLDDPAKEVLKFALDRKKPSHDVWTHLLGRPSFTDREVSISVGIEDEYPVESKQSITLRVIPHGWFGTWAAILVGLIASFLALAVKSDVLRDTGPQPTGTTRKPYSLAKMQAAWWFFLILASYLFIGLVTGDYGTTITSTVLLLMGISAATAVGSATIDAGKAEASTAKAAAAAGVPGGAAAVAVTPQATKGRWWLDILSDEHGVNFHRFQMAAWTAVLGVIFVHDVYAGLAMPDFDNTLLGLLGISAGTYLGLKTTSETKP